MIRLVRSESEWFGPGRMSVGDAMSPLPSPAPDLSRAYPVQAETPLAEVLETMIRGRLDSVVVLNQSGAAIGVFTTQDALMLLHGLVVLGDRSEEELEGEGELRKAA